MTLRDGVDAEIPYLATDLERVVVSFDDRSAQGFAVEPHRVRVRNARLKGDALSLDAEGFRLARHESAVVRRHLQALVAENDRSRDDDPPEINRSYALELVPLVRELTGAREVFPQFGMITVRFSHRSALRSWMTTAAFAHLDFARTQVDEVVGRALAEGGRREPPAGRFAIVQTWRPITPPPQDMPLAICDGRTVPQRDMVPMDFHGPAGSINAFIQSRACHYSPAHEWSYFPDMTPDEVLVFKGFDSAFPDAMNAMHTAFDDPSVEQAVPRGSIECRFVALY